jgi:membrane protein YdbS with pleckstrin-like domain
MEHPELVIKPSQWINSGWIIFGILGFPIVIPTIIMLWLVLDTKCRRYEFYEDRIILVSGIITRTSVVVYYYRMKTMELEEPFLYRLVGLSSIHIETSDPLTRRITIEAIPIGETLMDDLTTVIKLERKHNKVREFDMYNP